MKPVLLLAAGLAAFPVAALAVPSPISLIAQAPPAEAPKVDLSSPESTLRTFTAAISRADVTTAAACVEGTIDPEKLKDWVEEWKKPQSRPPSLTFTDFKATVTGETATAEYTLLVTAPEGPAPADFKETTRFRKQGESWRIVPFTPEGLGEAATNRDKPQVVSLLATMMAHPDMFTRARAAARQTACLSNMKQLAIGVLLVANDHNDRIALRADQMRAGLMPHVKSASVFQCPEHTQEPVSYSLNANLQGVLTTKIKDPARTIMLYEGKKGVLEFRHEGKACVGFANGRAAMVDAAAAKKLLWKP